MADALHKFVRWRVIVPALAVVALAAATLRKNRCMEAFVERLAAAQIGRTFNPYRSGRRACLLRERLLAYLESRRNASLLLVGEAAGFRGARVSGLPFSSERQLTGRGPAEQSASIVHRVLDELGLATDVLLWNVVPTHPGTERTNRPPSSDEVAAGLPFAEELAERRRVIAVGRVAERALGAPYVRHPARGGAAAFAAGLHEILVSSAVGGRPAAVLSAR